MFDPLAYATMNKKDDPYAWGDECGPDTDASSACNSMADSMSMQRTTHNRRKEKLAKAMKLLSASMATGMGGPSSGSSAPPGFPGFGGLPGFGGGMPGDGGQGGGHP